MEQRNYRNTLRYKIEFKCRESDDHWDVQSRLKSRTGATALRVDFQWFGSEVAVRIVLLDKSIMPGRDTYSITLAARKW